MTQYDKGQLNKIGDILNNQGIITQGQVGNNTIVNPFEREPDGVYQGNRKVGSAMGPTIDAASNVVEFEGLSFDAFIDPSKPLEYSDFTFECDQAPKRPPNTMASSVGVVMSVARCRFLGRNK
jgi:hypothetical protein